MGKAVAAWLNMYLSAGAYPIDSGETRYRACTGLIDQVYPTHGGKLESDGSWTQQTYKLTTAFAAALPGLTEQAGQPYIPVGSPVMSPYVMYDVLDSLAVQSTAITGLLDLALTRWDATWGGLLFDIERVFLAGYVDKYETFLENMGAAARLNGLPFLVALRAVTEDNDEQPRISVLGQLVESCHYYVYWHDTSASSNPIWRTQIAIDYALEHGMPNRKLMLGLPLFSTYWPVKGGPTYYDITHAQALAIAAGAGATFAWVETDVNGLVREKYADLGAGCIWLNDGETLQHRLDLVDQYDLGGIMLFLLDMGDDTAWDVIKEWRQVDIPERRRIAGKVRRTNWREYIR